MTEAEMRDMKCPWPKSEKELIDFIHAMKAEGEACDGPEEGYGKAVYVMSLIATAAFYYAAGVVGSTGFQASCADMDILKRTRGYKAGFRIIDYENLLYPQYLNDEHFPNRKTLLMENKDALARIAREKLAENITMAKAVRKRMEYVANLSTPEISTQREGGKP
jgi:hypothetical protein